MLDKESVLLYFRKDRSSHCADVGEGHTSKLCGVKTMEHIQGLVPSSNFANHSVTAVTMTSLELVDFINSERRSMAESSGQVFPSKGYYLLRHDNFMAKVPKVLSEKAAPKFLGVDIFTNNTGGRVERDIYVFPKREACLMAMSYSYEMQAKVFDRMTMLEEQQKPALLPEKEDQIKCGLLILESATRLLNLSNSSRLGALQRLQEFAGVPALVPAYAIDAPSDAVDGSSRPTAALTTLLKLHGSSVATPVAFRVLERLGVVERKFRPSIKHGQRQFWSITAPGLKYGKNITSPNNPRETQPHFFESRFPELLKMMQSDMAA